MAGSKPKNDKALDRIRIMVTSDLSNFNREGRSAIIRRYLIILYIANLHSLFRDAGRKDNDNLRYFSGPQLTEVARKIAKEWEVMQIKFDRSRTANK